MYGDNIFHVYTDHEIDVIATFQMNTIVSYLLLLSTFAITVDAVIPKYLPSSDDECAPFDLIRTYFQNGFTWHGVTVVNPFEPKAKPYKLLSMIL